MPIEIKILSIRDFLLCFMLYQIILTKTDCISNRELYVAITSAFNSMKQRKRNGCFPLVHTISSRTGSGIQDLKRDIARVIYREYERTADTDAVEEEGSENK